MTASYSLAAGCEANYKVEENGAVTVHLRSSGPLKPRAVYVGAASLEFQWVSTGKSAHWQFTPTLHNSTTAQYTQTVTGDGCSQITTIDFSNRMFPTSGLIQTNLTGKILAPAIQFDLAYATDLWVFLFRSPWAPFKIEVEKSPLTLTQGSTQAMTQISASNSFEAESTLRLDTTVHGEDFKRVYLMLKRTVMHASIEEVLGEVKDGMGSFRWKPLVRNFDVAFMAPSSLSSSQLVDFLKYMGVNARQSFFGDYLGGNLVFCDGSGVNYTLALRGEKRFLGKEEDKTRIILR